MNPDLTSQTEKQLEADNTLLASERTLLARERTFLAWIRTGLTSVGLGVAIARLILFQNLTHQQLAQMIGQLLILWGVFVFSLALISYRRSYRQLSQPLLKIYSLSMMGLTLGTLILIFASLILFWIITV